MYIPTCMYMYIKDWLLKHVQQKPKAQRKRALLHEQKPSIFMKLLAKNLPMETQRQKDIHVATSYFPHCLLRSVRCHFYKSFVAFLARARFVLNWCRKRLPNPSQNLTDERYFQKCFNQTCVKVQRAFLYLKTDTKVYAWPYFWLEVNCFDTANKCDITIRVREIHAYEMAAWYPTTLKTLSISILLHWQR